MQFAERLITGFCRSEALHVPCLAILARMLTDRVRARRSLTDAALDRLIPLETQHPLSIHKAMRHSVFAGGKRLRPVLCMEAGTDGGRLAAGRNRRTGAAVEMLHTYSLIHDGSSCAGQ